MVDTGNLGPPKSAATVPPPANPSSKSPCREEGELSSGEETAELPPTAAFGNKALSEPILFSSRNKIVRTFQRGSSANTKFHTTTKRYYSKAMRTKQVPFKLSNKRTLSWHKKASDDNLVIRFSDDDSGTDSGNSKSEGTTENKDNAARSIKCRMPMTSSQRQQELLQKPTNHRSEFMPKKGVEDHVSFLVTGKNSGSNFGHQRTSSTEKADHIQKQITALKTSISQVRGHIQDTGLADIAVESLRHQIAAKENALKVQMKLLSRNKEQVTGSSNNRFEQLNPKSDNESSDIHGAAAANTGGRAVNIQPMKRLKLGEYLECVQGSGCPLNMQEHSTKSMTESHQLHEGESSFPVVRDLLGKTLSVINEESDKHHYQVNENVPASSIVLHKRLGDNETMLPSCATSSPLYPDPKINSKQEANNIGVDASCSYIKRGKGPVPLASSLLDQKTYLSQMVPDLENATSSLGKTGLRTDLVSSDNPMEKCSVGALERTLQDTMVGISEWSPMNLESLLELEELQGKELEEAQELRRRCELEEMHALKAYRKAQRALINANDRCAILHRNRENISAKLQTLILESSNSLWPSNKQDHGESVQYSRLGYNLESKGQTLEQSGDRSNSHFIDGTTLDAPYKQMNRNGSCSNQYSEPDDSTSDQRDKSTNNGLGSPASFPYISTDEEENISMDNIYTESNLASSRDLGNDLKGTSDVDANKDENSQDHNLEAALRSKLVARFGMRTSCKGADMSNAEWQLDQANGNKDMKSDNSIDQQPQEHHIHVSNPEDLAISEGIMKLSSSEHCGQSQQNKFSFKDEIQRTRDPEENSSLPNESSLSGCQPIFLLPSSNLHNVLPLLKFKFPTSNEVILNTKEKGFEATDTSQGVTVRLLNVNDGSRSCDKNLATSEMSYSMCDISVDSFWPFCMFELRGKCNNDECPWQHQKRCTKRNLKRDGFLVSNNSDDHFHALTAEISHSSLGPTHGLIKHFLPIPAYYIGSSLIKDELHFHHSVLARSIWQYWQRGFSASFPLPFSIQRILPLDAPFLQSSDGTVADYDSWSRHSWYLQSQDGKMRKFIQGLPDPEQSMEFALDLFCGKVYKSDKKKALSVLSRAIEADPSSVQLWVIYLHIFYIKEKGIGKDDMFFHAVQHNGSSYELWLMFINSRVKLSDRLNSYEDALTALCNATLTCDKEKKYRSAHVLDIFFQMVDCLCMCGSIEKAIWRIYQLVPTSDSELSGDSLFTEILPCLTVPNQCIFWICCIYLVMYKTLPQEIVQRFELEKDLPFSLEWPFIQLSTEETDRVGELMKFALQKMALEVDKDHLKRDKTALRSLHFLAVSHVRFVSALNGFHRSAELLVKYLELYPTCIELVLLSVRTQLNCNFDVVWRGFQEILGNWPREVPGIQCLWNQWIGHQLAKQTDCAGNLTDQWFQLFGELSDPQCRNLDAKDAGFCRLSKQPLCMESANTDYTMLDDKMFGLINLSLHRMLKNDVGGACRAVDEALSLASPNYYGHCIREHVSLFLLEGSELPDNIHGEVIFRHLNNYLIDTRFLPKSELLSRKFYQRIKKPRIRQLIDEIIGPVPADTYLLNSVLEVCYGPTLLPQNIESKDVVDFVESLMELTPANYQLALSVYKFTTRNFGDSGSIMFWASSILVSSIFQSVPVAPENIWLEAAELLGNSEGRRIAERFHQQALSVYPFSLKLWKSYLDLSKINRHIDAVIVAARERGLELDVTPD
ncbi:hypothetical protein Cni_G27466 [Canna indica]|uniref:Putative zinc-finger domain-containing protein n=1 Tax=Canna indica TaxID=4628 RepID=A0AAQ3L1S8_9LILI|nr:hypothetical protein Cni_G27466 [Canna indica]